MSDMDLLDDDFEEPKKKGGLPKWLLGCGCGCTILIIALSVLGLLAVKEMSSDEAQWPALRKSLYFEERPTELEMVMGFSVPFTGQKQYTLRDSGGDYTVSIYIFAGHAEVENMFLTEGSGMQKLAIPDNATLGETMVQGRSVRSMVDTGLSMLPDGVIGPGIRIDLSIDGRNRIAELRVNSGDDALTDEELTEFFSMFDVWHE